MRMLKSEDAIMREMGRLSAVIGRLMRQHGSASGVPGILAVLAGREEAIAEGFAPRMFSQAELAQVIGIRPQSIGPLLTRLEDDGCIVRGAWEHDRRAHLVMLTDKGRAKAQAVRDLQRTFAKETLSVLSDEEKQQLASIVMKLNDSLE